MSKGNQQEHTKHGKLRAQSTAQYVNHPRRTLTGPFHPCCALNGFRT